MPYLHLSSKLHTSSYLLLLFLPSSFVLCLPSLYISSCSQQLKPGWSLSHLAGTANLCIVPFIRLAPTNNKTPLTRSLKRAARTQCDWVVTAFEWVGTNTLIYFLLFLNICKFLFSSSKSDHWATDGGFVIVIFLADKQSFLQNKRIK